MLQASLDQLQIFVRTPTNRDEVSPDLGSSNEVTLSIQTDEEKFGITRAEITNAIGALDLRNAQTLSDSDSFLPAVLPTPATQNGNSLT